MDTKTGGFCVLGLQRSGTNFLETMLRRAFGVEIKNLNSDGGVWKHGFEYDHVPEDLNLILLYKHPVGWVESMHRDCRDLLKGDEKGRTQFHQNLRVAQRWDVEALAKLYSAYHEWWLDRREAHNMFVLSYEDVLRYPRKSVARIGRHFGMTPGNYRIPQKVRFNKKFSDRRRNKYLNHVWWLKPAKQELIFSALSQPVREMLGFTTQAGDGGVSTTS